MLRRRKKKDIPALDVSVFERVIAEGDGRARRALALQLADLVADRAAPKAEREAATPVLLQLLMDKEKDVRAAAARRLQPAAGLHPDIVFTIVADDEDIALPFINLSPSVRGARQLAIFRAGDMPRRLAIVRRCDVDPRVIDEVAMEGEREVAAALLKNLSAPLDGASAKRLYVRFRDVEEITGALLERSDLPLEIRIAHVRVTSAILREKMRRKGWMAANDAREVIADSEERALMDILARAGGSAELMSAIRFMSRKDALTPSLIFRAACHGHVRVLEHALAHLAGISPKRVRALVFGRGTLALKAVYGRAGLPQGCFVLVRAIFDVARARGLDVPGQAGIAPAEFGRLVLERLATHYDMLPVEERTRLIGLLARFSDKETRALAERLGAGLTQRAA